MGLRGGFEWDGGTWKKRLIINTAALTRLPGMGLEIPQASEASMQWFKPSQLAPTLNYRPADYVRDILTKCPRTTEGEPQTHLKWPVVVIVVNWFRLHEALSNVKWFAMSWCNSCSVSTHWSYQVDLLMKKQPNTMRRTSNSWSKCKYTKPGCCRARVPIMDAKLSTNLLKRARKKSWIYHRKSVLGFESH